MQKRWKTNIGCVYNLAYHIIWWPKYRKRVLVGQVEVRLKELPLQKAKDNNWEIENMEIMPDHVHLFVKTKPTIAPHFLIQQIKGISSRILRNEFKELKRKMPSMWTRSYFIESVGHISQETIEKYIKEQKNK